jgi:MFS family permease
MPQSIIQRRRWLSFAVIGFSLIPWTRSFVIPLHVNEDARTRNRELSNHAQSERHVKHLSININLRERQTALFLKGSKAEERVEADEATIFGVPRDTVAAPLSLLLVSQFLLFIGVGAVIPSIPLYGKEIGLSSSLNGVVISAPAVALLLGAKFGGNFADLARKPAMLWGMAAIAISDVGTAMATGITTLILARLGLGAGRCIAEAGERGMLADLASRAPELRGRALAAQQSAFALGIAIGAPLGGIIVEEYGPRAAFLCVSAAALVTLILYAFLPETVTTGISENILGIPDNNKSKMTSVEAQDLNRKKQETIISQGEWKKLLKMNQWRGLALCQCGASFGFAAKIASIPILAAAVLPGGAAGAGALLSVAGLSGIVGAPIGGFLSDRTSAKLTAILSGIVSAAGLLLIPLSLSESSSSILSLFVGGEGDFQLPFLGGIEMTSQAVAFSAVVVMWSLGASAQGPAMTAVAQQLAPKGAEATAMALPRATGDGTYIAAPFLLGLVTDSVVSMPGAECACAGAATLLGTLALALLDNDSDLTE